MSEEKKLPVCCQNNTATKKEKPKGFWRGLVFGLVPHTFCILFIIFTLVGSVLGATVIKKFLIIPHFFLFLVILSLFIATLSAWLYLRSNKFCSSLGIKKNWKYLTILYSTTLLVNLIFIYYIFPAVTTKITNAQNNPSVNTITEVLAIKVDIPCSGHAPLIIDELKKVRGVASINYQPQNSFYVKYDPNIASENNILSLDVFKTYKATKI